VIKFPLFKNPQEFETDMEFPNPVNDDQSDIDYKKELKDLQKNLFQNKYPKLRSRVTILSEDEN